MTRSSSAEAKLRGFEFLDRVDYASDLEAYYAQYDLDANIPLSTAVTATVAAVSEIDSDEFGPLSEIVDVDALNRIFEPQQDARSPDGHGSVNFRLADCEVTLFWDGTLVLEPSE